MSTNNNTTKPTNRPRKVDLAQLARAVAIAAESSINNAERVTGISPSTIRNEMRRLGIARRRVGTFTVAEADKLTREGKLVL